ncbi:hypothetical protein I3760_03G002700 [Carya illinoinensis]|nr:hypothetical protein I3760_03G002700 [Carya illinoinensis]
MASPPLLHKEWRASHGFHLAWLYELHWPVRHPQMRARIELLLKNSKSLLGRTSRIYFRNFMTILVIRMDEKRERAQGKIHRFISAF